MRSDAGTERRARGLRVHTLKRRVARTLSNLANNLFYRVYRPEWRAFDELVTKHSADSRDFFFVQIGANDGVTHDFLHRYIQTYRWRGILVEPVPAYCDLLRARYQGVPAVVIEQSAISSSEGTRTLYRIEDPAAELPAWSKGLASLHLDVIKKHRWVIPDLEDVIVAEPVRCLTLESLLRKHQVEKIDLLSIDTEGHDFEVIKQIDFTRFRPRMIVYEHKHLQREVRRHCENLLEAQGYQLRKHLSNTLASLP
ncbi:MAG: FkbM family methyltransferase [Gammaproteobacteria bacterium]